MSEIKDGGPAFPTAYYETEHGDRVWSNGGIPGMGLRDFFAAKAMQGLLANPGGPIQGNGINGWNFTNCSLNDVAELSYQLADAMLKERSK